MTARKRANRCLGLIAWAAAGSAAAAAVTVEVSIHPADRSPHKDAIVVLDPLDAAPPAGHGTAVIDQINKQFAPQVTVIRSGTAVSFPNSDQIKHEVYSHYPPKVFELKLYAGRPTQPVVFDKPGLETLGCNVHDKMLAFIGIVDSPYFTKIEKLAAAGTAVLTVPPGRYLVHVWHPDLSTPVAAREIEVKGDPIEVDFALDVSGVPDPAAAWPWH